jgi:hypothetical protein
MEKRRFVIAVVVLLSFGLIAAGCGSDADDEVSDDPGAELEQGVDESSAREGSAREAARERGEGAAARGEGAAARGEEAAARGEEAAGSSEEGGPELDDADREDALRGCRQQARSLPPGEDRERALATCERQLGD